MLGFVFALIVGGPCTNCECEGNMGLCSSPKVLLDSLVQLPAQLVAGKYLNLIGGDPKGWIVTNYSVKAYPCRTLTVILRWEHYFKRKF